MNESNNPVLKALTNALDAAVNTPTDVVRWHIEQTRRTHPEATPSDACEILARRYLATVTATGASTGAAAAAPGVGTGAALILAGGDCVGFITASGLLALSFAEIHGISIDDLERRRTLVMAVLLGDAGTTTVSRVAERTGSHWGKKIVAGIPTESIKQINKVLGRNFVTKYGTKQGILVLGKTIPFGIGALIGGSGNLAFGLMTVKAAHSAFGTPPPDWPGALVIPFPEVGPQSDLSYARGCAVA